MCCAVSNAVASNDRLPVIASAPLLTSFIEATAIVVYIQPQDYGNAVPRSWPLVLARRPVGHLLLRLMRPMCRTQTQTTAQKGSARGSRDRRNAARPYTTARRIPKPTNNGERRCSWALAHRNHTSQTQCCADYERSLQSSLTLTLTFHRKTQRDLEWNDEYLQQWAT